MRDHKRESYSFGAHDEKGQFHRVRVNVEYVRNAPQEPWQVLEREAFLDETIPLQTKDERTFIGPDGLRLRRIVWDA